MFEMESTVWKRKQIIMQDIHKIIFDYRLDI